MLMPPSRKKSNLFTIKYIVFADLFSPRYGFNADQVRQHLVHDENFRGPYSAFTPSQRFDALLRLEKVNEGKILTDNEKAKYEASVARLCQFPAKITANQDLPSANSQSLARQDSHLFGLLFTSMTTGISSPRAVVETLLSFPAGRHAFDLYYNDYSRICFHLGLPSVLLHLLQQFQLISTALSTRYVNISEPSLDEKIAAIPINLRPNPNFGKTTFKGTQETES